MLENKVKKKLFFHIGYPKTATTSIQGILTCISKKNKLCYLGKDVSKTSHIDPEISKFFSQIANGCLDESIYQKACEVIYKKAADDKVIIISHERLIRPKNFLLIDKQFSILNKYFDLEIFITTRNMKDWIISRTRHDRNLLVKKNLIKKMISKLYEIKDIYKTKSFNEPSYLSNQIRFDFECSFPACKDLEPNKECFCEKYRNSIKEINPLTFNANDIKSRLNRVNIDCTIYSINKTPIAEIACHIIKNSFNKKLDFNEILSEAKNIESLQGKLNTADMLRRNDVSEKEKSLSANVSSLISKNLNRDY